MKFQQKLDAIISKNNSLVSIGLDPVLEKIPSHLQKKEFPFFEFNKAIINATHDIVCAYKPNSAFYEGEGEKGIKQLKMTCDYIRETYPAMPIILDFKRADIGNTNQGYVKFAYEYLQADAVTLHPYLGKEAVQPFLDKVDKGNFILCKTSNIGSGEFQNIVVDGEPLSVRVAERVVKEWSTNDNCMLVVGATYPEELKDIRLMVGDMIILVPGVGAQGGDVEQTLKAGLNSHKAGLIVSSSRSIIFASSGEDFADEARQEATKLRDEINEYR